MKQAFFNFVPMNYWVSVPLFMAVLIVLGLIVWLWFKKRLPQARFLYWFFWIYLLLILVRAFFYVYSLYIVWVVHSVSHYLLPPYNSWVYFVSYSWYHFLLSPVLNLALAYCWWWILLFLKKRSDELWLDRSDATLGLLTVLFVGWPNLLVYLALLFGIMVLALLAAKLKRQSNFRLPLTWPMLIATLITILFGEWIIVSLGGVALRI